MLARRIASFLMMNWSHIDGISNVDASASVVVNTPSKDALMADVERRFRAREGFTVATLNLDHVVKLRTDEQFRSAYARHSHITADGNPIVWLSRLSGQQVQLAPGSDLVAPVAEAAARNDVPVALFGSTDASLGAAAKALETKFRGLRVVAQIAPPMGFDPMSVESDALIEELSQSGARLVFLALGAPKQEVFAARAAQRLQDAGFLSIGAGLDFLSGSQKRAPAVVRALAAEWIWRMLGNPRRLARRYLGCIVILPSLTMSAMRQRSQAGNG